MTSIINIAGYTLKSINCFQNLTSEQRDSLVHLCRGRRYESGDIVISKFDRHNDVYFIVAGKARVTYCSENGKETELQILRPGESFGELSAIDGELRSADVAAVSDLSVVYTSSENFKTMLCQYESVRDHFLRNLTRLIRKLSSRIIEFHTLRVSDRIHAEILRVALNDGVGEDSVVVESPPTHAELAARIGAHREAVTRELSYLRGLGLMRRERRAWRITSMDRLRGLIRSEIPEASIAN